MRAVMMHPKAGCVEPENIYMLPGSSTHYIFARYSDCLYIL